jgi:hypothetical protein
VAPLVNPRWCAVQVQAKQRVHRRLCGADRILDGEYHVLRDFAELSDEGEIFRPVRDDLGAITFGPTRRNWLVMKGIMSTLSG